MKKARHKTYKSVRAFKAKTYSIFNSVLLGGI